MKFGSTRDFLQEVDERVKSGASGFAALSGGPVNTRVEMAPTDWEAVQDWTIEELHALETEFGCTVGEFQPLNGHYLVLKVSYPEKSGGEHGRAINLPAQYRKKAVGNLNVIKGLVLKASKPYFRKLCRTEWKRDPETGENKRHSEVYSTDRRIETSVTENTGIFYNSYNMGHIRADKLRHPLVLVREIDILSDFPREEMDCYKVGDFVMGRPLVQMGK